VWKFTGAADRSCIGEQENWIWNSNYIVCVCVCVCVSAGRSGYLSYTYLWKIGNDVNKFFIIRAKFSFKYSSQFNIQQIARKFHSLSIPLLIYIVSFYSENKLYFRKAWGS
jgi:hypothetical protein